MQQDLAAGTDEGKRLIGFPRGDGAHDIDARTDGSEVVGGPAHEREDGAASETEGAPATVEDFLFDVTAEADPVLDLLFLPGQFDMGEAVGQEAGIRSRRSRRTARCWS